jgi:hypothetical protein
MPFDEQGGSRLAHSARRIAFVALLGCAALAMPAGVSAHHSTRSHHQAAKASKHHAAKPAKHDAAKPAGVTTVPASGIKLYCAAGRNPLLIRKFTQGAGTTVTVVCR